MRMDPSNPAVDYNHPDWLALYSAVLAAPHKDPPRRAAAKWLRANGDPDRAEFIGAQLLLSADVQRHVARLKREAGGKPPGGGKSGNAAPRSPAQVDRDIKADKTQSRLANLVGRWYPPGTNGMGLIAIYPRGSAGVCGVMERGFVSEVVVIRLERWWEVGVDVCRHHPVCRVNGT